MAFYDAGYQRRRLRARRARRAVRDPREPELPVSRGDGQAGRRRSSSRDLELASRLSFFLWGSLPDEELLKLAEAAAPAQAARAGRAGQRMLADDRAKSLTDDFAFQWLGLAKLDTIVPDRAAVPAGERPARSARSVQGGARALHRQRAAQRPERDGADHGELHVPERARSPMLYGIETRQGRALPPRDAAGRLALRPARQGRDPDAHGVSEPHVARAARRVDHRDDPRRQAARAAAAGADPAGQQARRAAEDAARAARAASRRTRPASPATA